MTDREKVINGLELLAHWPDGLIITDKEKWIKPCCEMAVSLLKEQEEETTFVYDEYTLPMCKKCGFHPFAGYIPTIK